MELQYYVTPDDRVALELYHGLHTRLYRRLRWLAMVVGMTVLLLGPVHTLVLGVTFSPLELACFIFVVLFCLFWPTAYRFALLRRLRKMFPGGKSAGIREFFVLRVDQSGFTRLEHANPENRGWPVVEKIVEDTDHIYVYVGPLSAIIIPKRAFQDERHMQAFLDEARMLKAQVDAAASQPAEAQRPDA